MCYSIKKGYSQYKIFLYNRLMIKIISITVKPEETENKNLINKLIHKELNLPKNSNHKIISKFEKKSIDARHGQIKIHLKYTVYIDEEPPENDNSIPEWKNADSKKTVLIIGSGPAGLFAALKLLESGIKPVIIERGKNTHERREDIALISTKHFVNENSNYCFGEGGAGTFSDGKLYTRSNKRGDISKILRIFVHFGADKKILTDAHPHIGTDRLPLIINNIRKFIIEKGGEFYFNTLCTDLLLSDDKVTGIKTINTITKEEKNFSGQSVILATGHSSIDIYTMIAKINPSALEAKTFAAGVRVEHPRELIDSIQFHGKKTEDMMAAEYNVKAQVLDRGVYSFCMCPGGFIVPSSSGPDEIVVNGMSTAKRNSKWSNSAIVVEIRPEDIPQKFITEAEKSGCKALAGLLFRTDIEQKAKKEAEGQAAPSQKLTDFLDNKKTTDFPPVSFTPGITSSNLNDWLPQHISKRLALGFKEINKNMKGFISDKAVLIAPETRTSTPVRILRDKETLENPFIKKLYPCGEGSGYSGGIVSSAMDGEKIAETISKN